MNRYRFCEGSSLTPWIDKEVYLADEVDITLSALEAQVRELLFAASELLDVADLRGDTDLPHPADDDKPWTVRMQIAWDDLRVVLAEP